MLDQPTQRALLLLLSDPAHAGGVGAALQDAPYTFLRTSRAEEGLQLLEEHHGAIESVILDFPFLQQGGAGFIGKLKAEDTLAALPLIMLASSEEDMRTGITAGIYYFLSPPYEKSAVRSTLSSAAADYHSFTALRQDAEQHKARLHLTGESIFEIGTLDDVRYLATFLAQFYPDPEQAILGLSELLLNAVEHGNLGISYDEKTVLLRENRWEQEVRLRQQLPQYAEKRACVTFRRSPETITLTVRDEGKGFDWRKYITVTPERATHSHGRGIAFSAMMSFDEIGYNDCGNEVTALLKLTDH